MNINFIFNFVFNENVFLLRQSISLGRKYLKRVISLVNLC